MWSWQSDDWALDPAALQALGQRAAAGDDGALLALRRACAPTVRAYLQQKLRHDASALALVDGLTDIVFDTLRRYLPRDPRHGADVPRSVLLAARWVVIRYYEFSSGQGSGR